MNVRFIYRRHLTRRHLLLFWAVCTRNISHEARKDQIKENTSLIYNVQTYQRELLTGYKLSQFNTDASRWWLGRNKQLYPDIMAPNQRLFSAHHRHQNQQKLVKCWILDLIIKINVPLLLVARLPFKINKLKMSYFGSSESDTFWLVILHKLYYLHWICKVISKLSCEINIVE